MFFSDEVVFQYDWSDLYPDYPDGRVEFADIGCGYGGLLVQLSPMFPQTLMIGSIICMITKCLRMISLQEWRYV